MDEWLRYTGVASGPHTNLPPSGNPKPEIRKKSEERKLSEAGAGRGVRTNAGRDDFHVVPVLSFPSLLPD